MKRTHTPSNSLRKMALARPNAVLGALAAAISACYAPQVLSAEKGARQIDEVIVTARRRDEMAQDVPISMTVMTEDFLKSNNIQKMEDIGTKVPSLRMTQASGSVNEPIVTIRGQRQGESTFNQDPAAPVYVNDIAISPIQGGNLGLYDLEGLQVLKGPQGTLFGRNSTGGAVMITTKRPGHKFGGYAEGKIGDYDLRGFEGAVDVPLTDELTTRLAVRKLDRDGYQKNIATNELNGKRYRDEHSENVRLSINFENDALSNLLVLSYDQNYTAGAILVSTVTNKSVGFGRTPAYQAAIAEQEARDNPWKVKSDLDAQENVRNTFVSNTTEYEIIDDLSIKNIAGYRKVYFGSGSDSDGTQLQLLGAPPKPGTRDPLLTTVKTEFYSDELQLFGTALDEKLDWITGLYWSQMAGTEYKPTITGGVGRAELAINKIENTSYGLFAEGTYAFSDEWALTLGARQSQEQRELTVSRWSWPNLGSMTCIIYAEGQPFGGATDPDCARPVDKTFNSTTWKSSVNFTPAPGILLYGNISTGFRAGGFNTRGQSDSTLQAFDPEHVLTYELGHKQDWNIGDVAIRSSAALYLQKYEDIQNTVSFFEGGRLNTRTENAAKAEIKGLELELTIKPIDELTWGLSYSYVDAEFKSKHDDFSATNPLNPADVRVFGPNVDTSSNDFLLIPKQSFTSSVTYVLPLDPSIGDISLMAGFYWQDKMSTHLQRDQFGLYVTDSPFPWNPADLAAVQKNSEIDAYHVWNFRVEWKGIMKSAFDVAAYVDNATDEEYKLGGLNVLPSGGFSGYHYGAPRTVGASVRYSF